jgi:hypothetical protein
MDADKAAEGVDSVRLISPIVTDAESYQNTRRASDARSASSDRKGASDLADDESTSQLLRVSQAAQVFLPTGQSGKLVVTPIPGAFSGFGAEGLAAIEETSKRWSVDQRHVSGELFPLFAANQRRGLRSGFDQGDVSPHAALFIGAGLYQRLYERRAARTRRRYAVSLLVDGSASMLSPGRNAHAGTHEPCPPQLGAWSASACVTSSDRFGCLVQPGFAARPDDTEDLCEADRRRD